MLYYIPKEREETESLPMFSSSVTLDGVRVTAMSISDITEFLLLKNYDLYCYVLTGKMNQDDIEVRILGLG